MSEKHRHSLSSPIREGIRNALRTTRRLVVFLVFIAMLALNVASFAFEQVGRLVSEISGAVFGRTWVAELTTENARLAADKRKLTASNTRLAEQNSELRTKNSKLTRQLDDLDVKNSKLSRQTDDLQLRNSRLAGEIEDVSKRNTALLGRIDDIEADADGARRLRNTFDTVGARISRRIATGAARNIASIPLESAPFVGVLTIAAVTSAEVYDACTTFNEMQELRVAAGFEPLSNLMADTCDYMPFSSSVVDISQISIEECFAQSEALKEYDAQAGQKLEETCSCIQRNPGFEESCFPDNVVADGPGLPEPG